MLKFCRSDQKKERTKEEQRESAYNRQNAQFGLVMKIVYLKYLSFDLYTTKSRLSVNARSSFGLACCFLKNVHNYLHSIHAQPN